MVTMEAGAIQLAVGLVCTCQRRFVVKFKQTVHNVNRGLLCPGSIA